MIVNPLRIRRDYLNEFESSLVIAFAGQSRRSDTIIKEQVSGLAALNPETVANMHALKRDAAEMKVALVSGNIRGVAEILGHSWVAKKKTAAGISNPKVEELHDVARKAGAWAGKVSGARGWRLPDVDDRPRKPLSADQRNQRSRRTGERRQAVV